MLVISVLSNVLVFLIEFSLELLQFHFVSPQEGSLVDVLVYAGFIFNFLGSSSKLES